MKHATTIGRLGMLAAGLGIVATVAAGVATADSTTVDAGVFDPSALISTPDADIPGLNLAISVDGTPLFQSGNAFAYSGTDGNVAIAYGDGSSAISGTGDQSMGDFAFANGTGTSAYIGLGNFGSATAIGDGSAANAGAGNGDIAFVNGINSGADAGGYSFPDDDATVEYAGSNCYAFAFGNNDFADAGTNLNGIAGTSDVTGNLATIFGNGNDAYAGMGDYNIAEILGNSSEASAGMGNYDIAGVLGDMFTSTATDGSHLFDFMPML